MTRKTRRRGNGEGSTYQRGDGLWCTALRINGKRIVRYGRTREEVQIKLDQLRGDVRRGVLPQKRSTTQLLTVGNWIQDLIADSEAPGTRAVQRCAFSKIEPALGHRPLHLVTSTDIRDCFRRLECGSRAKQMAYDILKKAFRLAHSERRIDSNPMEYITRPRHQAKPHRPFSIEDVGQIMNALRGHRLFGFFALIFSLGMRQGEVLGARWSDVDWAAGVLTIRQGVTRGEHGEVIIRPPKTTSSVREVPLTEDLIQVLLGRAITAKNEGLADCDLIFPTRRGTPTSINSIRNSVLLPCLKDLGIAPRGMHSGRHSACTFMLRAGVPLHIVSGLLGHANAHITSQIYSHVMAGDSAAAVRSLGDVIGFKLADAPSVERR